MKRMTHGLGSRLGGIGALTPRGKEIKREEIRERTELARRFFDINNQYFVLTPDRQKFADDPFPRYPGQRQTYRAVDQISDQRWMAKRSEMDQKRQQDPEFAQLYDMAIRVHQLAHPQQGNRPSHSLLQLEQTAMNIYRRGLLGEQAEIIKERYEHAHIDDRSWEAFLKGAFQVHEVVSWATALSTGGLSKLAEHLVTSMLRHHITAHASRMMGIRRKLTNLVTLPQVLDEAGWVTIQNEDKHMANALKHAHHELDRISGANKQLISDLVHFQRRDVDESKLEQFMEILFYTQPLPQFRQAHARVSTYDIYIEQLARAQQTPPASAPRSRR